MYWLLVVLGLLLIALGVSIALACAPEGYEDKDGFHYGKPEDP